MRVLTSTAKTALKSTRVKMCYLVHVSIFKVGQGFLDIMFSTASHTMTFPVAGFAADTEWLGGGRMLDIQFAQEDSTLEVYNAEVTLSGLDATIISLALNENLERAAVTFYLALFNPDTNQPIGQAAQVFRGSMSNVRIIPPTGDQQ